jgi:hypothetical protein
VGGEAGFELAQLVRAPMNNPFTALTRPRISSGVSSCTKDARITMLIMSAAPSTTSTASENQNEVDRPKAMVATPNTHGGEHHAPTLRSTANRASHSDISSAPTAGPNAAGPGPRAGQQDVLGEHRQQRGGAAQQHGEQVQRDRPEDVRAAADEADAGQQRIQGGLAFVQRRLAGGQVEHQQAGDEVQHHGRAIDPDAAEGVEQAAEGRGDDGRRLLRRLRAATARGNSALGTMLGSRAWVVGISKERAAPSRKARMKIISRVTLPVRPADGQRQGDQACTDWQIAATLRRS